MKAIIAIVVATLAAAIVTACSQDDTVPGPISAQTNITALDTPQDIKGDIVDIRTEPDTKDSGENSNGTRATTHTPTRIGAVRQEASDSQGSAHFIRDSWMSADITTTQQPDITQDTNTPDATVLTDTSSALPDIFQSPPDTWLALDTWQPADTWQKVVDIVSATKDVVTNPVDINFKKDMTQPLSDIVQQKPDIINYVPDTVASKSDVFTSKPDTTTPKPDITSSSPDIFKSSPDTSDTTQSAPDVQVDTAKAPLQIMKFTKGSDGNTIYANTQFGYSTKFPSWLMNAEKKDGNLTLGGNSQTQANVKIDLEYIEKPGYATNFSDWFKELYGKPDHKVTYQDKTLQYHSIDHGGGFNRYTYVPVNSSGAVRIEANLSMPQQQYSQEFEQDTLKAMYMVTSTVQALK